LRGRLLDERTGKRSLFILKFLFQFDFVLDDLAIGTDFDLLTNNDTDFGNCFVLKLTCSAIAVFLNGLNWWVIFKRCLVDVSVTLSIILPCIFTYEDCSRILFAIIEFSDKAGKSILLTHGSRGR
jgi:hypothetical protein